MDLELRRSDIRCQCTRLTRVVGLVAALWVGSITITLAGDLSAAQRRLFESRIRPLLIKHCLKCHAGPQPKGALRLDSPAGWRRGGDSGPALIPGQPDNSLLMRAVRHQDGVSGMPPKKKLPTAAIQDLQRWIAAGAPDPRRPRGGPDPAPGTQAQQSHWSFQPVARPTIPPDGREWSLTPIDRFVARKQRQMGVRAVADADRYTWLRRVTLDLTGLPPTVAEIAAFVDDIAPDSHQRVVDRVLASRAFGQKWARHWLDLACYADTIGSSSMPMRYAWRYRDYVIAALNADKPLDAFVRQQIAGDLLPAESPQHRRENLIATGFLAIGPWQLSEQDKGQLRMDVVDHQITRIGTMFLGMTLDCARCHDHKFDPIAQSDYYAMAGIFANVDVLDGIWRSNVSGVLTVALPESSVERRGRELLTPAHKTAFTAARQKWRSAQQALSDAESDLRKLATGAASRQTVADKVKQLRTAATSAEGDWRFMEFHAPVVPHAHAVVQRAPLKNVRINIRGSAHALGDEVPRGFVDVIQPSSSRIPDTSSGRLELVEWLFASENPLTARVLVNRAWAQLMGRGLVEPVDYFGVGSGTHGPTHPELLDFLAHSLIRERWSLKALLRQIVLSRTYRLSSTSSSQASAVDPENRWLWRAAPRRLDAEMMRDSMLMVSGRLVQCDGGPAIPLHDRKTLRPGDLVNPPTIGGGFDLPPRRQSARSIYQPVIRSYVHKSLSGLELFDTPSPNEIVGHRTTTTVPTQSLYLFNSPFVKECAEQLATDAGRAAGDTDERRLALLWLKTFGRPIANHEVRSALEFLDTIEDRTQAWTRLCHGLLASNAFLFRR
ncbi:MAG: PSD1 and planctomycete cytochrome C domain-containing protein [Planctomycetaceae bacterium]